MRRRSLREAQSRLSMPRWIRYFNPSNISTYRKNCNSDCFTQAVEYLYKHLHKGEGGKLSCMVLSFGWVHHTHKNKGMCINFFLSSINIHSTKGTRSRNWKRGRDRDRHGVRARDHSYHIYNTTIGPDSWRNLSTFTAENPIAAEATAELCRGSTSFGEPTRGTTCFGTEYPQAVESSHPRDNLQPVEHGQGQVQTRTLLVLSHQSRCQLRRTLVPSFPSPPLPSLPSPSHFLHLSFRV